MSARLGVARVGIALALVALALVAVGVPVWLRIGSRADQPGDRQAVVGAPLDVGDRRHAHLRIAIVRIALVVAIGLLAVAAGLAVLVGVAVVAGAVLTLRLGDGGCRAAADLGAVADGIAVVVAEQRLMICSTGLAA